MKDSKSMLDDLIAHSILETTGQGKDDPYTRLGMLISVRYLLDEVKVAPPEPAPMPELKPINGQPPRKKRKQRQRGQSAVEAWLRPCPSCGAGAEQPCIRAKTNTYGAVGEHTKYLHRERANGNGANPNRDPR